MLFKVMNKKAISDMKEFCRLHGELTYMGEFVNKETSEVLLAYFYESYLNPSKKLVQNSFQMFYLNY